MAQTLNERVLSWVRNTVLVEGSRQFWIFQIAGWSGLSIVSYFSLNVWYDQPDLTYVGHNIVQSLLGVALSTPLRSVCRRVWDLALGQRIILISAAVLLFAALWSTLRLAVFQLMTGETGLWSDFGGWLFPSIFIFLCWTALYHGFKYYRLAEVEHSALLRMASERDRASTKAALAESAAREAQLQMLRYQLNPHFLFNTLNAIQSLVTTRQTQRATEMIGSLSDFLRYSLYRDSRAFVSVDDEVAAIRLYLEIEQARFGERLRISVDIAEEARYELIPSMLLQPLVENSIKHAVAKSELGGSVMIKVRREADYLCLAVIDSGAPSDAELPPQESGVGLKNIRQRLESCYGADHSIEFRQLADGGVSAELRVPCARAAATA